MCRDIDQHRQIPICSSIILSPDSYLDKQYTQTLLLYCLTLWETLFPGLCLWPQDFMKYNLGASDIQLTYVSWRIPYLRTPDSMSIGPYPATHSGQTMKGLWHMWNQSMMDHSQDHRGAQVKGPRILLNSRGPSFDGFIGYLLGSSWVCSVSSPDWIPACLYKL